MIFEHLFDFYYLYTGQMAQKLRGFIHSNNLAFPCSHSMPSIIRNSSKITENIKIFFRIKTFVQTTRRIQWIKTILKPV